MNSGDEEMDAAAAAWGRYNATPYAPYVSFPESIGMSLEQFDHWLHTGQKPAGWTWERD